MVCWVQAGLLGDYYISQSELQLSMIHLYKEFFKSNTSFTPVTLLLLLSHLSQTSHFLLMTFLKACHVMAVSFLFGTQRWGGKRRGLWLGVMKKPKCTWCYNPLLLLFTTSVTTSNSHLSEQMIFNKDFPFYQMKMWDIKKLKWGRLGMWVCYNMCAW